MARPSPARPCVHAWPAAPRPLPCLPRRWPDAPTRAEAKGGSEACATPLSLLDGAGPGGVLPRAQGGVTGGRRRAAGSARPTRYIICSFFSLFFFFWLGWSAPRPPACGAPTHETPACALRHRPTDCTPRGDTHAPCLRLRLRAVITSPEPTMQVVKQKICECRFGRQELLRRRQPAAGAHRQRGAPAAERTHASGASVRARCLSCGEACDCAPCAQQAHGVSPHFGAGWLPPCCAAQRRPRRAAPRAH